VISKQQASERQRKIAEQRARLYLAEQQEQARQRSAQTGASTMPKAKIKPRYIAVKTGRNKAAKAASR